MVLLHSSLATSPSHQSDLQVQTPNHISNNILLTNPDIRPRDTHDSTRDRGYTAMVKRESFRAISSRPFPTCPSPPGMVALEAMSPSSPLSSPLSSIGSRSPSPPSPSPPADYPSPPSTDVSDTGITPSKSRDAPDRDEPPPAKRQKIMKPREMKTEHLDLRRLNDSDDGEHHKAQDAKLNRLMEVLRSKKKIVVIAGAGISVSAGSTFNLVAPH
jgi:hypothetical protein